MTRADLETYEPAWSQPVEVPYRETRVLTRRGLSRVPETLARLPELRELDAAARVAALVEAVASDDASDAHTTNLVTVDSEGNACVITTSLGLGSGDFLPGLDLHLNSMLGEVDLVRAPLEAGARVASMMAPTLVLDDDALAVAAGAAGGTRLRTALVGVLAGIVDERLEPQEAVDRPRVHPVAATATVNAEPGAPADALEVLEQRGWNVRVWDARHHYFGGVSLVTRSRAAADPRRSGAARLLR